MLATRLLVLLGILVGLLLFAWSNWSPILSLTLLGIKMPALPLAIWVLGAIAAGVLTSLLFSLLFSLSNFATGHEIRTQRRWAARRRSFSTDSTQPKPSPDRPSTRAATSRTATNLRNEEEDVAWQNWDGYEDTVERKPAEEAFGWKRTEQPVDRTSQVDKDDDWETIFDDDWGETAEKPRPAATAASTQYQSPPAEEDDFSDPDDRSEEDSRSREEYQSEEYQSRERIDFERPQEPRRVSRSGSTYSYSYRDSNNPAVGRAESVIDAEYRVIIPPHRPLDRETEEKDD